MSTSLREALLRGSGTTSSRATSDLCTEGKFVSRGPVLLLSENHELAEYLWKDGVDHDRWDAEKL